MGIRAQKIEMKRTQYSYFLILHFGTQDGPVINEKSIYSMHLDAFSSVMDKLKDP